MSDEQWRTTLAVNLDSSFALVKHAVAQMKKQLEDLSQKLQKAAEDKQSEREIQEALRHHAPRGRETERIGPFLATFTLDTSNPFLNYAIPVDAAIAAPADVESLVAAYEARERKPRLEYIPSVAPAVEAVLLAAGFEVEGRLPLMTCETPVFASPPGIELVAPSTKEEFRGVAEVQWEAYEERDPITDSAVEGLRRTADTGGVVVLARDAETGQPAGGRRLE